MAITTKQRAELRSIAANEDTVLTIGKSGITEAVIRSCEEVLAKRELIKGRVLENSLLTAREACTELCEKCKAEPVQVIGTKFVLYRNNDKKRAKN